MDNVQAPNYPQNVTNAEPVSRATADAGILAAVNALALAEPALKGGARWPAMLAAPADYRDELDDLVSDVQFAKANPRLTPEAKMADARRVAAAWRPRAESIVAGLELRVREWTADLDKRTRPAAPISDRAALEAALANARADARMVLDAAEDGDLADRLGELARDDEVLRHLILATDWPATYFRARGAKSAPLLWPAVRRRLLAEYLDAAGVNSLGRLDAMAHARKAAVALRAGHELLIANNRAWFEDVTGA
jgi:hypothetical protein